MSTPAIETIGLTKHYGQPSGPVVFLRERLRMSPRSTVQALESLDIAVRQGEVFGFLGPNGAGKSTTIRLLLGFLRPTAGSGRVLGLDTVRDSVAIRRRLGYLPSGIALFDTLTGEQVLDYLGRYTHRVAISNNRLLRFDGDSVLFRWKDYRHGSRVQTLTLEAGEFLRRFLLHVLPRRFVRIRYFGFLASRCRTVQLPQCRRALAGATAPPPAPPPPEPPRSWPCPRCGASMRVIERLTPRQIYLTSLLANIVHDTS